MERSIVILKPVPPFDFNLTAGYATYFRGEYGADSFQNEVFRRALDFGDRLCLISVRSPGTLDSPLLEMEISGADLDETVVSGASREMACLLGVNQNLADFYSMAFENPVLSPLVRGLRGLHIPQTLSIFEGLVLAIMGQQISSHVARMLRTLFIRTYGRSLEVSKVVYHAFPRPRDIAAAGVEGLRSVKLSAMKARYIVDIAARVAAEEMDMESLRALPDDEVVRSLTGIRGVGPWTAQWLLIRAFGRADGFPHGDLALQRAMGLLLLKDGRTLGPEEALKYSRAWSPFRSFVTTYLFAAVRSGRFARFHQSANAAP